MSIFSRISARRPKKNKFDLSHERKMSIAIGRLIPILVQDVVPGDSFRVNSEIFLRMAPLLAPIMHRINVYTHYFFVPNRLVWNEWEDFITGGKDGTAQPVAPYFVPGEVGVNNGLYKSGTLYDYMGLPPLHPGDDISNHPKVSCLPFRAYQLIYNEYYRDQNLSDPVEIDLNSGQQHVSQTIVTLRNRAWEKDYFTSALPWPQRGGDVSLPIESEASWTYRNDPKIRTTGVWDEIDVPIKRLADGTLSANNLGDVQDQTVSRIANLKSIDVENTSVTINELRRSMKLQEWLEKNARGGARYIEQILSHFGVRSSDARLQRPEYLGGGRQPVSISEVLQTYQDEQAQSNPLGTMGGHGVSVGRTNGFKAFFEEHGYVIGIMSVLPKSAYQQGIPRHFSRETKFDYYWPEFAHIGEQEIKNKELYLPKSGVGDPEGTFGYAPRYSEYKYMPSTVHGSMRTSLAFWHLGRIFNTMPVLNDNFVRTKTSDFQRIFAVEDEEHMYVQLYNKVDALRPMPYFGTPTF